MHFYPTERVALFVDGANLYATAKTLGFDIDYKKLLNLFRGKGHLVRALYYTALAEDQEYSSIRPLIDWLDYNGFTIVTKPTKEFTDAMGRRKIKGNMDIELAVDAMQLADSLDHIVLFSGDGDFRSLVEALQQKGRRVSVVSTLQTQPPMVADELRRQADQFIDLADLEQQICRDPSIRAQREQRYAATRATGPVREENDDFADL
ncbi:MAG: NYN domain-containing protein [Hyphomicrobiaceae bacterium]